MNIDISKKYRVKNLTDSVIVTISPSLNGRRREWKTAGAISYVPLEEIEDVMQTYGGRRMYEDSLKVYADDEILEHLGLETAGDIDTSEEALEKLFALDYVAFEKRLQRFPKDTHSRIVNYAVKNNINDLNLIDILTENTKINVLREIRNNRENSKNKVDKTKAKPKSTYEKMQEEKEKQ